MSKETGGTAEPKLGRGQTAGGKENRMASNNAGQRLHSNPRGLGYRWVMAENEHSLAISEYYRVLVRKKGVAGEGEILIPVKVRRITIQSKRSGVCNYFPLTRRNAVESFGDSRETSFVPRPRHSFPEMRIELARMVGPENADRLLSNLKAA